MEQKHEEVDDDEIASSDSFIDDSDEDEPSTSGLDEGVHLEEPLSEEEIEALIAEFLEVESKAAEAQETLEQESLIKVEAEVREELAQTLSSDDLEKAVAREMEIFREEWEGVLDELEADSSQLLEQLDGAGIELPSLYKWIESQAPNTCCTEAWKRKTHWMGSQVTNDVTESIADAEKYLQIHRPVRKRHGKLLEEGASGFLQRKIAEDENHKVMPTESSEVDWSSFNKIFSDPSSVDDTSFGGKQWASVYLASTPQQAAAMGLKFPGVDEVEEIDDVDGSSDDPFLAAALANERELDLFEEQKRNIKKVKEEDDVHTEKVLQLHLKRKRRRNRSCQEDIGSLVENNSMDTLSANDNTLPVSHQGPSEVGDSPDINNLCKNIKGDVVERMETSKEEKTMVDSSSLVDSENYLSDVIETNGLKRSRDNEEQDDNNKKSRIITIDIDDSPILVNKSSSPISNIAKLDKQSNTHENGGGEVGSFRSEGERFKCTACGDLTVDVHQHPLLKAIICNECNCKLEEKMHVKDLDCSECYCRWCGRNSFLLSCKSCKTLFCTSCIRRNFGDEFLSIVRASGWECCCCSSKLLRPMTLELERALNCTVQIESSGSDDGSDNSDMKIDAPISSRRRRKKGIRRIIDDAELGEETQQKIAIEKERQERLKSLQAQFSDKSWTSNSGSCSLPEGATVEVLGDAVTGYIVNVVREKGEDPVRILPSISAKLKVHQVSGIRFMWENIIQSVRKVKSGDKGLGCILAHTMGLGKTFQVIAFLYTAMRSVDLGLKSALIVTPVNVLHNWRQEFMKWKPTELKPLRVYMLEDVSRERRVELLEKWRAKGGIFLIGYSSFRNLSQGKKMKDRQVAAKISSALHDGPDILVCDEAHMIKNTRADVTQALKQVKCQRRIALTGSPLQNNLMEYYCMVDFVREGFLGSSLEFRNRFQNPIENGQHANSTSVDVKIMNQRSHILYEQLKGFVQRMDTSVVKKDMPPKTVFVIAVKLSPLQRKLYKRFLDVHGFTNDKIWNHPGILQLIKEDKDSERRDEAVENFLADDSSSDENTDYNMVIGEKPRNKNEQAKNFSGFLQQDWWNGLLHENNYDEVDYSGKMVLLLDILTMCSDVGDKALVFSQSIRTLDLMEKYLSKLPRKEKIGKYWKKGEDWYRLDGKTAASDRQKLVERFNEPLNKRVKCALISTRAGSLGINLYAANRVIIMDGSWNPTYDLQAIYRAWRYGQKKPVFAYRFVAHGTMEEKIYKRQVTKEGLAARVVDRQQVHRTMSKEEMLHLFEFGDDNLDMSPDFSHDKGHNSSTSGQAGDTLKHKLPLSFGSCSSDKLMDNLLGKHHPKWVANYHEHETLLQENEEEKLSKEEQDMAWEVYRRSLEWEEVSRVPVAEPALEQKPSMSSAGPPAVHSDHSPLMPQSNKGTFAPQTNQAPLAPRSSRPAVPKSILQRHELSRKCTNLSHLLTIRSQGTKFGCSTVCGQCGTEISWEDLNKDSKSAKKNNLHSS